jgi:hypothetical protein
MRLFFDVQEVAVVQGLQTEITELVVAAGVEDGSQAHQIKLAELLVEQFGGDALLDEFGEILGVALAHLRLGDGLAQHLVADGIQQQARGDEGIARVLLDHRARGEHQRLLDFGHRHAVIEVAQHGLHDRLGLDVVAEAGAGVGQQRG